MDINIFAVIGILTKLPQLGADIATISTLIKSTEDGQLAQEIASVPVVAAKVGQISNAWRNVENAEIAVTKSHFLDFFTHAWALGVDTETLGADVAGISSDPELVAAVENLPELKAFLSSLSDALGTLEGLLGIKL